MKEKILAQLKAKYKGAPAKLLGQMADKLAAKVTKEDEIEGAISELENQTIPFSEVIAQLQEEGDSRVAAAKKKWEKENPTKQEGKTDDDPNADNKGKGDDAPAWAKTLIESNKTMSEKLAALEREKAQAGIQGKISGHEKLKDVPAKFYSKRPLPEKEEDIDSWVNEVSTDWGELQQDNTNNAFGNSSKPFASAGNANGISSAMQQRIDARTKPAENAAIVGKQL